MVRVSRSVHPGQHDGSQLRGGSGSIADIYLCETNANPVPEIDREVVNAELDRLRSALRDALHALTN